MRTTQEALDHSIPTTAVVMRSTSINDPTRYPSALRQIDATPAALAKVQELVAIRDQHNQDAFFVVDLGSVEARVRAWRAHLPQIEPFYAVKCCPDPEILQLLAGLGCGFDCASRAEVDAALAAGAAPDWIIYANPTKQASHIAAAATKNVRMMTFDSIDELDKIHRVAPSAQVVLRLYVDDTKSKMRLGAKFGAPVEDAAALFGHAKALGLDVIGVSFHVGSGCFSGSAYADAVESARRAFNIGATLGFQFSLLDVGGGFPSVDGDPIFFHECASQLSSALQQHFQDTSSLRVIAEPGRFFVAPSHTLVVNVIGRKLSPAGDAMYFVNDGIYGSFNGLLNDHPTILPVVITNSVGSPELSDDDSGDEAEEEEAPQLYPASIWGPTCDGTDCVLKDVLLPRLRVGEWIVFPGMGAYTSASSSSFNGFAPPVKVFI